MLGLDMLSTLGLTLERDIADSETFSSIMIGIFYAYGGYENWFMKVILLALGHVVAPPRVVSHIALVLRSGSGTSDALILGSLWMSFGMESSLWSGAALGWWE
ncbi:hypothetical protein Hypma_014233 [Hypsizygus marmoreus]|uniref:Uncharacterized protein n=1 Tax=Hypsizygus marmoreus TaxID=39966 RepID=A0A369JFD3_HYPMA|nr:hypothetical protein Hypma_014233 [Hypsizygus marmoreus]